MNFKQPLFWQQGQFLQPQHFQYMDQHHQSLFEPYQRNQIPYFWGISTLKMNKSSLNNKVCEFDNFQILFEDGSWINFPENAVVESRSFEKDWVEAEKPFSIFIGVKRLNLTSPNVAIKQDVEDISSINIRYIASLNPDEIKDIHAGGGSGMVKTMKYHVKVFWESELESLGGYTFFKVAVLKQEGEDVTLLEKFIPPSLTLSASPILKSYIQDMKDQLASRCHQLEEYKSPREMQKSGFEPGYMVYLMSLRTLNFHLPLLVHLVETPDVHPWTVYGMLRQLAGELSTFSDRVNALGELRSGTKLIPAYDHNNLFSCFSDIHRIISEMLNDIILGPEHIIRLEFTDELYVGELPPESFDSRNDFYLVLRCSGTSSELVNDIFNLVKLSCKENIETLITRALQGLALSHCPVPPAGLPRRSNAYYFKIEKSSSAWADLQTYRNIALYWDSAPDDLVAEIIIIKR